MLDGQLQTLRDRLKHATSGDHMRVDALFSTLALTEPVGLGRFLAAHRGGFDAMLPAASRSTGLVSCAMLSEMIAALDQDLACLGITPPRLTIDFVTSDAIDHIVLGSRLGTAVLRRHWETATDPKARAAAHYFSLPGHGALWRTHTDHLRSQAATGASADRLIADTRRLYRLFETTFHHVT